jgi:hypothetical protein
MIEWLQMLPIRPRDFALGVALMVLFAAAGALILQHLEPDE